MTQRVLAEMETLAHQLRNIIMVQPPKALLGYIYGQRNLRILGVVEDNTQPDDAIDSEQFLLEYIHATLATTQEPANTSFDEEACASLYGISERLRQVAMMYTIASSSSTADGSFGPETGKFEVQAKGAWVLLRGHRYQVLEEEFYAYVLAPHDDVLRETYGIGAKEIAAGFQAISDTFRVGQSLAIETLARQFDAVRAFETKEGKPFEEIAEIWGKDHADEMQTTALAMDDVLCGGTCNISRHTTLPAALLADLAFKRGEETEFFADGPLSGTPFRTLPARKKPLIQLGGEYYAIDPCFVRDAGYRALLHNLLLRQPTYKKTFENKQKILTESAFADILQGQFKGACVYQEVYYRNPKTGEWVENDTLLLIDDVLLLVEAKSGAAATITSPAVDFERHRRAVQDLVVKAYEQCCRFFDYLASAHEVPIYRRENRKYVECARLRRSDYRVILPIGLTVESFSPFSAMCKELPGVTPLLDKHSFISMSIDDLFVLNRFLPTMGELAHYLEFRQSIAGKKGILLFDELDHLGAYIQNNSFDMDIDTRSAAKKLTLVICDGMSDIIDQHFTGDDWNSRPVPRQKYPDELSSLLAALDRTRHPGWLKAESQIRNYEEDARRELAKHLKAFRLTLNNHEARYFCIDGRPKLFIWLQCAHSEPDIEQIKNKSAAAALATNCDEIVTIIAWTSAIGPYTRADNVDVTIPSGETNHNTFIYEDAAHMRRRLIAAPPTRRPGRNDPCWCGSGIKFKKCHNK